MNRIGIDYDENESDSLREEMKRDKLKKKQCPICNGEGKLMPQSIYNCPTCNGSGEVNNNE